MINNMENRNKTAMQILILFVFMTVMFFMHHEVLPFRMVWMRKFDMILAERQAYTGKVNYVRVRLFGQFIKRNKFLKSHVKGGTSNQPHNDRLSKAG
jgi:hypothetical protein